MPEKQLLLDIGNTRIKWCHALQGRLQPGTADAGSLEEFVQHCARQDTPIPDEVLISSVARPALVEAAIGVCRTTWGCDPRLLQSQAEQGGVKNAYSQPEKLGVDRWLAIVGAAAHYGLPVVVWDLGTATTLDAVDAGGQHIGGWILPGPETMLESLTDQTQLDVPQVVDGDEHGAAIPPGSNTTEAISLGVYAAQKGALNQFMKNFASGSQQPCIILTGGASKPMGEHLGHLCIVDPLLVFKGMLVAL